MMIPTRQKLIGENKVEEYHIKQISGFWPTVYINGKEIHHETSDQVVTRLERETLDNRCDS